MSLEYDMDGILLVNESGGDHSNIDLDTSPPKPDKKMLYGWIGEIGKAAAETTEANPYAVFMDMLVMLSAEMGRGIYLPIGNTYHHPNLFALHVGRSGRGRKGEALSLPMRIRSKAVELDPSLFGQIHTGGLSTREGLTLKIHDGYTKGKTETPPIDDKRLFIVESEFSNVLHQARREGNTLSGALRDIWDGQTIQPATKSDPIGATDPHISLLGCITPAELTDLMRSRELLNGFANRFLIFFSERTKIVSMPVPTDKDLMLSFADQVVGIVEFAKGDYPANKNSRAASLIPSAAKLYGDMYQELGKPVDGDIIDGILERRPANLLRMALCFAISDRSLLIETRHIEAAYAWIKYSTDSVRYIFQSAEQELISSQSQETAEKIFSYLREKKTASKTEISNELFKRHKSSSEIDDGLMLLLSESPPRIEMQEVKGAGRAAKIYSIAANYANLAN